MGLGLGIDIGIVGILIGILGLVIQNRSPQIDVKCSLAENDDPTCLECVVINSGLAEAKNVYVGFNNMLPVGTKLFSRPEYGLEIIEANLLLNPNTFPNTAHLTKAFSVFLPRVARKSEITFQVKTIDNDNIRAGKQILRIREEINNVLTAFGEQLSEHHPEEYEKWDAPTVIQERIKNENIFTPGKFSYVKGEFPVLFITNNEKLESAVNQDLYSKFKKEHLDVFTTGKKFKASVIRIKVIEGESTYAILPPYVTTYVEMIVSRKEIKEKGGLTVSPPVPESYD